MSRLPLLVALSGGLAVATVPGSAQEEPAPEQPRSRLEVLWERPLSPRELNGLLPDAQVVSDPRAVYFGGPSPRLLGIELSRGAPLPLPSLEPEANPRLLPTEAGLILTTNLSRLEGHELRVTGELRLYPSGEARPRWRFPLEAGLFHLASQGTRLVGVDAEGVARCLNRDTGELQWTSPLAPGLEPPQPELQARLRPAGLTMSEGRCYALLELAWHRVMPRNEVPDEWDTSWYPGLPAGSVDALFREELLLCALALEGSPAEPPGRVLWTRRCPDAGAVPGPRANARPGGQVLLFNGRGSWLLDGASGSVLAEAEHPDPLSYFHDLDGTSVLHEDDGRLRCVELADGSDRWSLALSPEETDFALEGCALVKGTLVTLFVRSELESDVAAPVEGRLRLFDPHDGSAGETRSFRVAPPAGREVLTPFLAAAGERLLLCTGGELQGLRLRPPD